MWDHVHPLGLSVHVLLSQLRHVSPECSGTFFYLLPQAPSHTEIGSSFSSTCIVCRRLLLQSKYNSLTRLPKILQRLPQPQGSLPSLLSCPQMHRTPQPCVSRAGGLRVPLSLPHCFLCLKCPFSLLCLAKSNSSFFRTGIRCPFSQKLLEALGLREASSPVLPSMGHTGHHLSSNTIAHLSLHLPCYLAP